MFIRMLFSILKGKIKPGTKFVFPDSRLTGVFIGRKGEYAVIKFSSLQILEQYFLIEKEAR